MIECGIEHFVCTMRVFEVRASSSALGYLCAKFHFFDVVPNFVYLTTSIAELAYKEKLRTQSVTQPAYLMRREPKLLLWSNWP